VSERCFEFIIRRSGAYTCPYSPKCVEGVFCEVGLPLYRVLRSSDTRREGPRLRRSGSREKAPPVERGWEAFLFYRLLEGSSGKPSSERLRWKDPSELIGPEVARGRCRRDR
jgi:hypothetical protein